MLEHCLRKKAAFLFLHLDIQCNNIISFANTLFCKYELFFMLLLYHRLCDTFLLIICIQNNLQQKNISMSFLFINVLKLLTYIVKMSDHLCFLLCKKKWPNILCYIKHLKNSTKRIIISNMIFKQIYTIFRLKTNIVFKQTTLVLISFETYMV